MRSVLMADPIQWMMDVPALRCHWMQQRNADDPMHSASSLDDSLEIYDIILCR